MKKMASNIQEISETYSQEHLSTLKRDDLRQIAKSFKILNIKKFCKTQLIQLILEKNLKHLFKMMRKGYIHQLL